MNQMEKTLDKLKEENKIKPQLNINDYEAKRISGFESVEVDERKIFTNKMAVGKYFLHVFPLELNPCPGTWNWLSILYFQQLLSNRNTVGDLKTIFVPENYSFYPYRHLLKAPYDICKFYKNEHGEQLWSKKIDFILMDNVNVSKELYRRIAENQDIIKNHEFIKTARKLFYNEKEKSLKKNVSYGIKRLIKIWKQYERSFDMYRMPSEHFFKLLNRHPEFHQFIK